MKTEKVLYKWRGLKMANGKRSASFDCPKCGKPASITKHNISMTGKVAPSVVCPYKCGFHEWIILDGWNKK